MHASVLLAEVLDALQPRPGAVYIDGTVGAGGHTEALLQASAPDGRVYGFDQDPAALDLARQRLAPFADRVTLIHANFEQLAAHNLPPAHGLLLDLGLSSMQVDRADRGFSFQQTGPLDMRMDPTRSTTAAELVNHLSEKDLADLIYQYGEERQSRRIARAIVARRPIQTTGELVEIIQRAYKGRSRIHPATRTFQALRIAVNDELGALERTLPQAVDQLQAGGRLVIISFHSLEDRIVKHYFKQAEGLKVLTKKPLTATAEEIQANPRARSAKLRAAEKV